MVGPRTKTSLFGLCARAAALDPEALGETGQEYSDSGQRLVGLASAALETALAERSTPFGPLSAEQSAALQADLREIAEKASALLPHAISASMPETEA